MNAYVIALLSVILLIPVFFLLKLGFTNKGKTFTLGVSLVIAMIGLLSKSLFAQWQTILILFLFIIVVTLFGMKRMESVIFIKKEENSLKNILIENNKESVQNEINQLVEDEIPQVQPNRNLDIDESLLENDTSQFSLEDISVMMESLESKEELQGHSIGDLDDSKDTLGELNDRKELDDSYEYFQSGEINPSAFDDNQLKAMDLEFINEQEDTGNNYLAELEQIMLEDSQVDKLSLEDHLASDSLVLISEDEIDSSVEPINKQQFDNLIFDEMDEIEEITASFEAFDEVAVSVETEVLSDLDNIFAEDISELEENMEIKLDSSTVITSDETEENIVDTNNPLNKGIEDEELHKLLFKTMISQIQLTSKLMSSKKYEQMLCEYLHPELPISEYYTIGTFLVQHYISQKQFDRLLPLLNELEEKVTNYPMLLQEIQFLKTFYSKN